MAIGWANIRLPTSLLNRLKQQAIRLEKSHTAGYRSLPAEYCQRVPLHYALEVLLDEVEAHQERSRKKRN